ncbi:hypothetical protein N657DRAFT_633572 [Parathielavia appendiculata]|uniref:Uncharacterized protein n=1 Tax=Parathielavia appendiculata TaxID=2587402 RepID=A0AAN6U1A0_9PEZI|nr:hypothetical protein N657DRAFT_633572 [Parathielavia appendiculata]
MLRSVKGLGGSVRGHSPSSLLQGGLQLPVSAISTPLAAHVRRIGYVRSTSDRTTRPVRPGPKLAKPHKSVESSDQALRFKRPEASSSTEPSIGAADGNTHTDSPSMTVPALEPAASVTKPISVPPSPRASARPQASIPVRKPIDTSSKEYKQAASRYVRFVVAFPFLIVTSYFLYERLVPELKTRQLSPSPPAAQEPRPVG